jgi:hypothetical protein
LKINLLGIIVPNNLFTPLRFEIKVIQEEDKRLTYDVPNVTYIGQVVRELLMEHLIPEQDCLWAILANQDGKQKQRLSTFKRYFDTFVKANLDADWQFYDRMIHGLDNNDSTYFIFMISNRHPNHFQIIAYMDELMSDMLA